MPLDTRIDVINLSIGTNPLNNVGEINAQTEANYLNVYNARLGNGSPLTNSNEAVLVKAAGNERVDAQLISENYYLVRDTDANIKDRILIVGALDKYVRNTSATLDTRYSNFAGSSVAMQRRFLVEYGGSPFGESAYLCDKDATNFLGCEFTRFSDISTAGTSFAAPRVAGLAALVKGKFNNLSGAQTAKILLDTATTEGLSCYPACDANIYGQGRVNITDALSPIGKLR